MIRSAFSLITETFWVKKDILHQAQCLIPDVFITRTFVIHEIFSLASDWSKRIT